MPEFVLVEVWLPRLLGASLPPPNPSSGSRQTSPLTFQRPMFQSWLSPALLLLVLPGEDCECTLAVSFLLQTRPSFPRLTPLPGAGPCALPHSSGQDLPLPTRIFSLCPQWLLLPSLKGYPGLLALPQPPASTASLLFTSGLLKEETRPILFLDNWATQSMLLGDVSHKKGVTAGLEGAAGPDRNSQWPPSGRSHGDQVLLGGPT